MIPLVLLTILILAITTTLVIRQVAHGNARQIEGAADLEGRTRSVDILAFRNLMDPEQAQFLRESLPPHEYRRLQRLRNRAGICYVNTVYENAAILIRLGETLRRQPANADEGARIVDLAIQNRIAAALLLVKLGLGWLYPVGSIPAEVVARDYSQLRENVTGLLRRVTPLKISRILAEL